MLEAEETGRGAERDAAAERRAAARDAARAAAEAASEARASADAAGREHRDAAAAAADARTSLAAARAAEAEARARAAATEALAEETEDADADLEPAHRSVRALEAASAALAPQAEAAQARLSEAAARVRDLDAGLTSAQAEVEVAERAAAAAGDEAHRAEVEEAVAAERAGEAGPAPPDGTELPAPDEAAALVEELERRRAALGEVNPLAAGEREELGEREAEMAAQIEDLEGAAAALRDHLHELDAAVAEGFDAVFDGLRERFGEVCGLLFPGGEGRLRAVADEEGEDGIEVEVVPAGKRARSLSLMSGGERSLVALAFLLSLAMARPAPFYLLDEVEAALDDVNLGRFLSVVRSLSERTQFILITHQQPTVEAADTLFGVTMAGEGVSQVVARRLSRDVEGPAQPYVRRALRAISGGRSA